MPRDGGLDRQDAVFPDVLYAFTERWMARTYAMIWHDVGEFTSKVLAAVFGKKGGSSTGSPPIER